MSKILNEVLSANKTYASTFGDKAKLALPTRSRLRHPHLHGRPPRPRQIRGPR